MNIIFFYSSQNNDFIACVNHSVITNISKQ